MTTTLQQRPALSVSAAGWSFAAALTLLTGCGSATSEAPVGTVSGKVMFQGRPVPEGEINFYSPKLGTAAKIALDSNGSYALPEPLEAGDYKVSIVPPAPPAPTAEAPPPPKREFANIPLKYRSETLSDLTASVKPGSNEFTFEMRP